MIPGARMSNNNDKKTKEANKKRDEKFPKKNIKHDPPAESARAVFGLKNDNSRKNDGKQ